MCVEGGLAHQDEVAASSVKRGRHGSGVDLEALRADVLVLRLRWARPGLLGSVGDSVRVRVGHLDDALAEVALSHVVVLHGEGQRLLGR